MKVGEYLKTKGLTLRMCATTLTGMEADTTMEARLRRWYTTQFRLFDCVVLGVLARRNSLLSLPANELSKAAFACEQEIDRLRAENKELRDASNKEG